MKRFLRWTLLNVFTIGVPTLGYFTGEMGIAGTMVGIWQTLWVFLLLLTLIIYISDGELAKKTKESMNNDKNIGIKWTFAFEPFFVFWIFYMGYGKIGILMVIEVVLFLAIVMRKHTIKKENE